MREELQFLSFFSQPLAGPGMPVVSGPGMPLVSGPGISVVSGPGIPPRSVTILNYEVLWFMFQVQALWFTFQVQQRIVRTCCFLGEKKLDEHIEVGKDS